MFRSVQLVGKYRFKRGFTLTEICFSLAIVTLLVTVAFSSITYSRITSLKSKERGMVTDFLIHYAENIKSIEFSKIVAGYPVNPLYDGSGGAILIALPSAPADLSTSAYRTFHPDLELIRYRTPRLHANITTTSVSGTPHSKHIRLRVEWDAPINRGPRLSEELTIVRVKDL